MTDFTSFEYDLFCTEDNVVASISFLLFAQRTIDEPGPSFVSPFCTASCLDDSMPPTSLHFCTLKWATQILRLFQHGAIWAVVESLAANIAQRTIREIGLFVASHRFRVVRLSSTLTNVLVPSTFAFANNNNNDPYPVH